MAGANGEVETVLVSDNTKERQDSLSSSYLQTTVLFLEVSACPSNSNSSAIHIVEAD